MRFAVQPDLPESRSAPLMVKTTLVTLSPILPELTPSDRARSPPFVSTVLTRMPVLLPPVTAPIVNPLMVIPAPASAALAAMVPVARVITISVDPGVATVKVVPLYAAVTPLADAKNEAG